MRSYKMGLCFLVSMTLGLLLSACGNSQEQADLLAGEAVVKQNCKVCHAQGINGAPVIGNLKMWQPRLVKGRATLVSNAVNGYGLMPPKGGRTQLSEAEIDLAVGYLLSQVKTQQ